MEKVYVKPEVIAAGSANAVASMSCSSGGSGRSHCLRA